MDFAFTTALEIVLQALYGLCVTILFLFGLNTVILSVIYLFTRKRVWAEKTYPIPASWPRVTIQLPIYNERYMVRRLLQAVANLDYPASLLEIQVLDDSNDATRDLARALVFNYQQQGYPIQYIHRSDRSGFKAGALNEGLRTTTGEFIAIFDADFIPPQDWLQRVLPPFSDPRVGFVQTRWGHHNDRFNLITRLQSLALDGHFIVEQGARNGAGLLMSFNGSAGIWRRATIEDAGGWTSDTLTEDLDLSYRAQLRGWKPVYLPAIVVPAEVPANIVAVKKQQYRWSKGTVQTLRKLIGPVLRSRLPLSTRFMAFLHLMMYIPFPFLVATLLLVLPVGLVNPYIFYLFPYTVVASLGPPLIYSLAVTEHLPRLRDRLALLPALMLLGVGISINCAQAALVGLFRDGGTFERTPKYDLGNDGTQPPKNAYRLKINSTIWVELGMGIYNLVTLYVLWPTGGRVLAPWLATCALGYFMIAWLSLWHHWRSARTVSRAQREKEPLVFH